MNPVPGVVTRLSRSTRSLFWLPRPIAGVDVGEPLEGPPTPAEAAFLGEPPCPLTECLFSPDGKLCLGPIGGPPIVLSDEHFLRVATLSGAAAGAALDCDENWRYTGTTASSVSQSSSAAGLLGSVQILATGAAGRQTRIEKDQQALTYSRGALWFSSRALAGATGVAYHWGLRDVPLTNYAMFFFDGGAFPAWTLIVSNDGGATLDSASSEITPGINEVDIVVAPGEFAAGWVDGIGPFYATNVNGRIPTTAQATQPLLLCQTTDGAARALHADYARTCWVPAGVVNPAGLPLD